MNKFLISNAFKTLDEATRELREGVSERPADAVDLDELQDAYIGKRCTLKSGESGTIVSLQTYCDTFEKSFWGVALDNGATAKVLGRDISMSLEEKLPGDLGDAYKIASDQRIFKNTVPAYTLLPDPRFHRGEIPYDFDKADYKKIS